MSDEQIDPITLARANEMLRQERETFDLLKIHEHRWFMLRLAMGCSAVILLPSVAVFAGFILVHEKEFSYTVVASAASSLFVDVLGFLFGVWKIVIKPPSGGRFAPVTQVSLSKPRQLTPGRSAGDT